MQYTKMLPRIGRLGLVALLGFTLSCGDLAPDPEPAPEPERAAQQIDGCAIGASVAGATAAAAVALGTATGGCVVGTAVATAGTTTVLCVIPAGTAAAAALASAATGVATYLICRNAPTWAQTTIPGITSGVQVHMMANFRYKRARCQCTGASCSQPGYVELPIDTKNHNLCEQTVTTACQYCFSRAGCLGVRLGCDGYAPRPEYAPNYVPPVPAPTPPTSQGVCGSVKTCYKTQIYSGGTYRWRANCSGSGTAFAPTKLWGTAGAAGPCFQCDATKGWVSSSGCPTDGTPTPPPATTPTPTPSCNPSACSSCTCYKNFDHPSQSWKANCSGVATTVASQNGLLRGFDGKCYQCQSSKGWVWVVSSACN